MDSWWYTVAAAAVAGTYSIYSLYLSLSPALFISLNVVLFVILYRHRLW